MTLQTYQAICWARWWSDHPVQRVLFQPFYWLRFVAMFGSLVCFFIPTFLTFALGLVFLGLWFVLATLFRIYAWLIVRPAFVRYMTTRPE